MIEIIKSKSITELSDSPIVEILERNENALITFLNPYSYLLARNNLELFKSIDYILPDGVMLAYSIRIFLKLHVQRRSFDMTSLAKVVFEHASASKKSLFIIGTEPQLIEKSISSLRGYYPNLNIIGSRHGYFNSEEEKKGVIESIVKAAPNILIVGMGTPLQEDFLVKTKEAGWQGTGFTCGGFLHQSINNLEYYPVLVDRLELRWLYRMFKEKHLRKRFFASYPKFPFIFIRDFISYTSKKK